VKNGEKLLFQFRVRGNRPADQINIYGSLFRNGCGRYPAYGRIGFFVMDTPSVNEAISHPPDVRKRTVQYFLFDIQSPLSAKGCVPQSLMQSQ